MLVRLACPPARRLQSEARQAGREARASSAAGRRTGDAPLHCVADADVPAGAQRQLLDQAIHALALHRQRHGGAQLQFRGVQQHVMHREVVDERVCARQSWCHAGKIRCALCMPLRAQVRRLRDHVPSRGTVLLHISAVAAHEHLRRPPAGHQHLSAQQALSLPARQHVCAGHRTPVRSRPGPAACARFASRCGGPVACEAQGAPSSVVLPLPLGPICALRSPCERPASAQLEQPHKGHAVRSPAPSSCPPRCSLTRCQAGAASPPSWRCW